jgi:hypothetical protein
MAQHVVGAHFGAGVEGVGENLGEKKNAGHCQWNFGTKGGPWQINAIRLAPGQAGYRMTRLVEVSA